MIDLDDSLTVAKVKPYSNNKRVQAELINLLYQQTRTLLLGLTAAASAVAVIFYNNIPNEHVLIWITVVYCLTFVRYLFAREFKLKERSSDEIINWGFNKKSTSGELKFLVP